MQKMADGAMTGSLRWIVYAAGLLVLAGLAYGVVQFKQLKSPAEESPLAPEPPAAAASDGVSEAAPAAPDAPEIDPVTAEMAKTRAELKEAYEARRAEMPEDVAKPIADDIGMIEGVVADLLAAMVREPENDGLKKMLVATYRNEFRLLKKALHLSGGESEEGEVAEEPAAVASPAK